MAAAVSSVIPVIAIRTLLLILLTFIFFSVLLYIVLCQYLCIQIILLFQMLSVPQILDIVNRFITNLISRLCRKRQDLPIFYCLKGILQLIHCHNFDISIFQFLNKSHRSDSTCRHNSPDLRILSHKIPYFLFRHLQIGIAAFYELHRHLRFGLHIFFKSFHTFSVAFLF